MLDRVRLTACDGILASVCRSWPAGHAIIEHPAHPETMAADIGQDFFLSRDEPSCFRFSSQLAHSSSGRDVCHIVFFVFMRH